jgi:hypothetical protein
MWMICASLQGTKAANVSSKDVDNLSGRADRGCRSMSVLKFDGMHEVPEGF